MKNAAILFLGCAMAGMIAGCATEKMIYREADNGRETRLRVGETFTLELPGNPTTGYAWRVDRINKNALNEISGEFVRDSGAIGAGGQFQFKFEAIKAGMSDLRLVYSRAWEKDKPALKTFFMKIIVTSGE